MRFAAIDQGTTSTRAAIVEPDGQLRIVFAREHKQHYPARGQVEHDAEELLANLKAAVAALCDSGPIRAVGLANQGESCLGWDAATGAPVGRVIVWQDDRTAARTQQLRTEGHTDFVRERAGLPIDPYFSATKLALIAATPEAQKLRSMGRLRLGTTDAFFRDRLSGRFETDPTTASRTSLMALETLEWDDALCDLFGVPRECLPQILPTTGDLGDIDGVPLAASVVDQQAALFGHGARRAGDAKITFGTGAFALALTDRLPDSASGVLPTVAWAETGRAPVFALDGGVYAASSAVNWARGLGLFRDFSEIDLFPGPSALARGVVFVPALSGLAAPHWDRAARGAWLGLDLATGASDMMQALLEGVVLRTAEVVDEIERHQPLGPRLSVDGGLTANQYFLRFLANVTGREVAVAGTAELTALGAAALAARAERIDLATPPALRIVKPEAFDPDLRSRFAEARATVQSFARRSST